MDQGKRAGLTKVFCAIIVLILAVFVYLQLDNSRPWKTKDIHNKNFDLARFDLSPQDDFLDLSKVLTEALPVGAPHDEVERMLVENAGLTAGASRHWGDFTFQRYDYKLPTLRNMSGIGQFWIAVDYDSQEKLSQIYIMRKALYPSQPKMKM